MGNRVRLKYRGCYLIRCVNLRRTRYVYTRTTITFVSRFDFLNDFMATMVITLKWKFPHDRPDSTFFPRARPNVTQTEFTSVVTLLHFHVGLKELKLDIGYRDSLKLH